VVVTTSEEKPSIGLNLTWLIPGVVGGSEEYSIRLLAGVGRLADSKAVLRVYGRRDLFERYPELTDAFLPVVMPGRRISRPQRIALERTWLTRASASDAVVHHMGGTVPFVRRRGTSRQVVAVTIHDLQPVDLAHNFSTVKRTWLGRLIPFAVDHADLVVCPSRFTADRIIDRYGTDPSKLRVVPQGYDIDRETDPGSSLHHSSMAKLAASEMASRVVDRCVQMMGRFGLVRDTKIEKLYRQARPMRLATPRVPVGKRASQCHPEWARAARRDSPAEP